MSPVSTPTCRPWSPISFEVGQVKALPLFPRRDPMAHLRPPIADVKSPGLLFLGAIGHRDAFMLPQVLGPTVHQERFHISSGVRCIFKETPAHGPVAPPDTPHL